jgi:CelD/BcsL family acetyltransferase involved in cellulose biosynthesis
VGAQAARVAPSAVTRPSWVMDVSRGYDAYVEARLAESRKVFRSTQAKLRKLEREVGALRFDFASRDASVLAQLVEWKSAQYRRTGRRDRFARPWIATLVRDLLAGDIGVLSALYAGDHLVAAHFGLRSHGTLSCWFPAYDTRFARYSPGLALHLEMARAAAAEGLQRLDLGKGDEPYKLSLRTGSADVAEVWLERRSAAALVRRAQREPVRRAHEFVLARTTLRHAARQALATAGRLRSAR